VPTLFERLGKERTAPPTKKAQKPPAQLLLDWLQRWTKDTVTAREICIYGPNSLRDRKRALDAAERLVRNGWLIPLPARKYHHYEWQVVRRTILDPAVTADSPLTLREPMLYPSRSDVNG
jgi:hypothetical protein